MRIPRLVEVAIRTLDVIKRGNCEYVPMRVVLSEHEDIAKSVLTSVCHQLTVAGILEGLRGFYGGYKQVRGTSALELTQILTPSFLSETTSAMPQIQALQKRLNYQLECYEINP